MPAPTASTLGGVESLAAATHNFLTSISTAGVPAQAQPAAADLSDYSVGTWTPGITFGGGNTGITYAGTPYGFYTKIGNRIFFQCDISLSSKGSSTGGASLTGFPFAANGANGNYVAVNAWVMPLTAVWVPMFYLPKGGTTVVLNKLSSSGSAASLLDTDFANSTEVMLTGHYQV
jgi:hypothetical protein